LNKPLWQIHGSSSGAPCEREIHISYHNGDHYNSVRRMGDTNSNVPARIKLSTEQHNTGGNDNYNCDTDRYVNSPDLPDSGTESDYENSPSSNKMTILADRVEKSSSISDRTEILQALHLNAYCVETAVDYLLSSHAQEAASMARSNLWQEGGTGNRIFGDNVSRAAVAGRNQGNSGRGRSGPKTNQEKLEGIQAKLGNKNLSNKRRKELKKAERRVANEERRRAEADEASDAEVVIANVKTLTI